MQTYRYTSDRELASDLFHQKPAALLYLYDHYGPSLYGLILAKVPNEQEACAVLVKAFAKVWQDIELYDCTTTRFFTWLLLITDKVVREHTGRTDSSIVQYILSSVVNTGWKRPNA